MDDLPTFALPRFQFLIPYRNDEELFEKLRANSAQLLPFFQVAVEDETWSEKHFRLIALLLQFLTRASLEGKLDPKTIKQIIDSFHKHRSLLASSIPKPVQLQFKEHTLQVNPLIALGMSSYLALRLEALPQDKIVQIQNVPFEQAELLLLYLEQGYLHDLFRYQKTELEKLLQAAEAWGVAPLARECEKLLSRYIESGSLDESLLHALEEKRYLLAEEIVAKINAQQQGVRLSLVSGELCFEPLETHERVTERLGRLAPFIVKLKAQGMLPAQEIFWDWANALPRLRSLDLSGSEAIHERWLEGLEMIQTLDLSRCSWVNDALFAELCQRGPHLQELSLTYNTQLTSLAWPHLRHCKHLKSLDLCHLPSLSEQDLRIIRALIVGTVIF